MERAADVILAMRMKGVRLWADSGRLRYRASGGNITNEDLNRLIAAKNEILRLLQQQPSAITEPLLVPRKPAEKVPLTFPQQSWWNALGLEQRHSNRSVFSAVRLLGRINLTSLKESFAELARHHQALRTVFITDDGVLQQRVQEERNLTLDIIELPHVPNEESESLAERLTWELVTEPVDVSIGPMFSGRLIKLRDDDHVLVIAADHLISDAVSTGILLRDIWTLYGQSLQGLPFYLPKQPVQFADFAVWQQKSHLSWLEKHGAYWATRLSRTSRLSLFSENKMRNKQKPTLASLPIKFGNGLSAKLRDLSRQERTTLPMVILCAYVASVLCWSETACIVVPFVTTGRIQPELEHVVGYFGCPLFLLLELSATDTFLDLLRRCANEYASAYEHHDLGRISAQMPRPEFTRNFSFGWYPTEFRIHQAALTPFVYSSEIPGLSEAINLQPFAVNSPLYGDASIASQWDGEGGLLLTDAEDGITGAIAFRSDHADADSVSRFGQNLIFFAERLSEGPQRCVRACYSCP